MFRKRRIYLDFAAGAEGNPSSPHEEGRRSREQLQGARQIIARLVECKSDDIIFTSGATEANALAILSFAKPGAHLLYLPSAHASIVENMKLAAERGASVEPLPIKDGRVDVEKLQKLLRPETMLVSMDAVCGETGTVWNTREVGNVLHSVQDKRGLLHVDASQAPMTENVTRAHFGADLLTFDSTKVAGPRGAGCLVAHSTPPAGGPLAPLYGGGGQERGLRSGSENVEAIEGFAAALARAVVGSGGFRARAAAARADLIARLSGISNLYINEGAKTAPHILNFSLVGRDTDYLVALLDEAGYAVSTKSACETDSADGSRAVYVLTGDQARAQATLRVSWGPSVSTRELAHFAEALVRTVAFVDRAGRQ